MHARSRIVSITEKVACSSDDLMTLSVLPETVEHAAQGPAEEQPTRLTSAGTRSVLPSIVCVSKALW